MKEILIPLNFTTTPTVTDTKQSFSTSDEASGVLTFTTTADVAGTVASLTLRNASENANRQTVLIERLDVNSSPFSYVLKNPLPFGQYEGTVLLKKNLTVIASATFLFGVNSSLSAEVLPDLVKAYSLDELVENVETEVSNLKDAYNLTVSETVKGVNKTESTLQAQENVRYLNEHTRKTNEEIRIANEQARIAAELLRKDTFDTLVDSAVIEETVAQEVANEFQQIESTYANRLLSTEQQLEQTLNKSAITLTHMFADNTARDVYFVANPTELVEQLFVKVGTGYQQYLEGAWQASAAIVTEQLSATNQPIIDTGNYFTTDNTNAALQELGAHKASTANPHGVTKAQVGLGNVDNTSDVNKPVSAAMQTALNLKADKTTTDGINTRLTAEETATANNKVSAVKGKTFADVDARLEDVEADTTLIASNSIPNSDFSAGMAGFSTTSSYSLIENGIRLTFLSGESAKLLASISASVGDVLFVRFEYSTDITNGVYAYLNNATPFVEIINGKGSLVTATSDVTTVALGRNPALGSFLEFKRPIILNLTTIFGASNIPTAIEVDRLLSQFPNTWFKTSENLFSGRLSLVELIKLNSGKANKVQEAWITPPLINGWTGTASYRKNQFGNVETKGLITGGTVGTSPFTYPTDYRPLATVNKLCRAGTATPAKASITTAGVLTISDNNSSVSLDDIEFPTT